MQNEITITSAPFSVTLTDDELWRVGAALRLYSKEKSRLALECPSQTRAAVYSEGAASAQAIYERLRPAIERENGATVTAP